MENKLYIPVEKLSYLRSNVIHSKRIIDISADNYELVKFLYIDSILPIIKIYQPIISSLASHNSDFIYRARKCERNTPFNKIRDLYNPPISSGRSCVSGAEPILYTSSSSQTALSEIGVKIGDLVNIATFQYTTIASGQYWFVGQLGTFFKSQDQTHYLGDERKVQNPFYVDSEEAISSLIFQDNFFNEVFSKLSTHSDTYTLNSYLLGYIKENHFQDNDFCGVVFVSTKDIPGVNFAIYGKAIEQLPQPNVTLVKITYIDEYGCISFKTLQHAKNEGDYLIWSE